MKTENNGFCKGRKCFFFPLLIAGLFAISAVVMLLWNWILPGISSMLPLTYWQAMGLFLLCRILFGGFRFARHHHGHRPPYAQPEFKDKFMEMTDEEKLQFKNQWKNRCCKE
jgi:hypothetical protein